jgi:hypothetical protein
MSKLSLRRYFQRDVTVRHSFQLVLEQGRCTSVRFISEVIRSYIATQVLKRLPVEPIM